MARSVRLALAGELVPDAVNVQGGVIAEDVRPGIPLAEKLGRFFTALAGTLPSQLDVEVRGEIAAQDVRVLELAVLKGMFTDVVEESVTYVNAPVLATDRGVGVRLSTDPDSPDYRNLITRARHHGRRHPGLVVGHALRPAPRREARRGRRLRHRGRRSSEHMAVFRYEDRPGIVGTVGRILGEANVNIAGMQVSRDRKGGHALRRHDRRLGDPARRARRDRLGDRRRERASGRPHRPELTGPNSRGSHAAADGCRPYV